MESVSTFAMGSLRVAGSRWVEKHLHEPPVGHSGCIAGQPPCRDCIKFNGSSSGLAVAKVIGTIDRTGGIGFNMPIHSTDRSRFLPSRFSLSSIKPLGDAALRHWGLLASPFFVESPIGETATGRKPVMAADFYFRSPPHVRMLSWLQSELSDTEGRVPAEPATPRVLLLRSQIGAGVTMAMRQLTQTNGIGKVAVHTRVSKWNDQSVDQLASDVITHRSDDATRTLWCVHAFRPTQVQVLCGWLHRNTVPGSPLTVLIRIEDHPGTRQTVRDLPTFTLARTEAVDRIRCVKSAFKHAGATAPIMTCPAIEALVRLTDGSFFDLAVQTHHVLAWSHAHRFDLIGERVIGQYLAYHRKPVNARWRRAA